MSSQQPSATHALRWALIRDVVFFQLKLVADALRDLLLSPLSLIAAVIDLATSEHRHQALFYRLLKLGRRSEAWINLFGAAEENDTRYDTSQSLDQWMLQVERVMKEQYEKGGVTANAKNAVDRLLDRIRNAGQQAFAPPAASAVPTPPATAEHSAAGADTADKAPPPEQS